MYTLKTSAHFDSAHFLAGYHGKCANLHGHRWTLEATFASENLQEEGGMRGMVLDFATLKTALRDIADNHDHTLLYEEGTMSEELITQMKLANFHLTPLPFRPTAECLAKYFFEKCAKMNLPITSMTVYETPENCATYTKD